MNEYEIKAKELVQLMGNILALRFVNANIECLNETKEYWENIKTYLPNLYRKNINNEDLVCNKCKAVAKLKNGLCYGCYVLSNASI